MILFSIVQYPNAAKNAKNVLQGFEGGSAKNKKSSQSKMYTISILAGGVGGRFWIFRFFPTSLFS